MDAQETEARRGPKPNPDTRDNLLRAGVRMFHAKGYAATGIKDIVEAAGVPKGSFYNHFASKEAFGKATVDSYFEAGLAELAARLEDPQLPPRQRLRDYFEARAQAFREAGFAGGCLMGNLSLEIADHSAPIRASLATHFQTWSGLFEACIRQAQAAGAIRNPAPAATLADFLLDSWEGALLRMRAEQSDAPLRRFVEVAFGTVLV